MSSYLVKDSTMTAIADAIRTKTGSTDPIYPGDMPTAISGITTETEDLMLPTDIPDYVRTEVAKVASKVRNILTNDSIVSICISDTHYYGNQGQDNSGLQTNDSCIHAAMAIKALTYLIPVDFIAHMGDVAWGANDTTPEIIKTQIEDFVGYIQEGRSNIPVFIVIGNHDPCLYYGKDYIIDGEYLYENFTAHSASENTVFSGEENGGYCYRDFPDKKLRVFLLNTSENIVINGLDSGCSLTQQLWVAQALQNLNAKNDAAEWGFIALCHYPFDYGDARAISKVFMQYVNGGSITLNGTTINFNGSNKSKFICQYHGHIHNFIYSRLHALNNNTMEEYDAWRLSIPNAQYNRENYYSTVYNIPFKEDQSYPKTPNTSADTSFVVNVVNPVNKIIHSFCYGAGYDREINYANGIAYYAVTKSLERATISNEALSVKEGDPYTAILSPMTGYVITSVKIIMGSDDITSSVYNNGEINIPSVTGDIDISVEGYTNQIKLATESDGTTPYNGGKGYKTGARINSSMVESSVSGMCCTGFIPIKTNDIIRIKNVTLSGSASTYAMCLNEAKNNVIQSYTTANLEGMKVNDVIVITVSSENQGGYFRLSCGVIDDSTIITINEEITG